MIKLKSHVSAAWHEGRGEPAVLLNPATEEPLAESSTAGIDFKAALVSSVYSDDRRFAREMLLALAPYHGRLTLGGEELGGLRGLSFYLQRTAVQGYQPLLEKFFPGAE